MDIKFTYRHLRRVLFYIYRYDDVFFEYLFMCICNISGALLVDTNLYSSCSIFIGYVTEVKPVYCGVWGEVCVSPSDASKHSCQGGEGPVRGCLLFSRLSMEVLPTYMVRTDVLYCSKGV